MVALKKGDIVWVFQKNENGWWGGNKDRDVNTYWFPKTFLVRVPDRDCEECDDLGDISCSPSSSPRDSPLFTSDNRCIASPQKTKNPNRWLTIEENAQDQSVKLALERELRETKHRIETLTQERDAALQRCHNDKQDLSKDIDLISAEHHRMKESHAKEKNQWQQDRFQHDKDKQQWKKDRQHLEQQLKDRDTEMAEQEQQVRRLQAELKRAQDEAAQQHIIMKTMQTEKPTVVLPPAEPLWWLQDSAKVPAANEEEHTSSVLLRSGSASTGMLSRSASGTMPASGDQRPVTSARPLTKAPAESRVQSANNPISRRLFSNGCEGSRTPPAPNAVSTMPAQSGISSAPAISTISGVQSTQSGPPSGRQGVQVTSGCPRPSPRSAQVPLGWMQGGGAATVGVPSSPRHRPRAFGTSQENSVAPPAPVRSLVSTWEGRSNSLGATGNRRSADPSPTHNVVYTDPRATTRGASAGHGSSAASRTTSREHREVPSRTASRSRLPETSEPEPMPSHEDVSQLVNLGMSPMPRHQQQPQLHHSARQRMPSSSPSSKASVISVQDRIRQLNQQRNLLR